MLIDYATPQTASSAVYNPLRAHRIVSMPTSEVRCDHCARMVLEVVGQSIVVIHRHDGQYHKSVVTLESLGLEWKANA